MCVRGVLVLCDVRSLCVVSALGYSLTTSVGQDCLTDFVGQLSYMMCGALMLCVLWGIA